MRRVAIAALLVFVAACGSEDIGTVQPPDSRSVTAAPGVQIRIHYDDASPHQVAWLTRPAGEGPHPVVVFIHGGFWRNSFDASLAEPQAADAVSRGFAAWNIEYRRVGDEAGGVPGPLEDVSAAVDHLAELADFYHLDLERVAVVGHSAGGHLAFWVGQRAQLPNGAVGADPAVVPRLVVGQAPVANLANNLDLGGGAVVGFVGAAPTDAPDLYDLADPTRLLPVAVRQLIVHGEDDTIVPFDRSAAYETFVAEPDLLDVASFAGADHFDVIDPAHASWMFTMDEIAEALA